MAAYDAAQRGLSVALVERGDFGAATSSNHFKTVHGGLRSAGRRPAAHAPVGDRAPRARPHGAAPGGAARLPHADRTNADAQPGGVHGRLRNRRLDRTRSERRAAARPAPAGRARARRRRMPPAISRPGSRECHQRGALVRLPDAARRPADAGRRAGRPRARRNARQLRGGARAHPPRRAHGGGAGARGRGWQPAALRNSGARDAQRVGTLGRAPSWRPAASTGRRRCSRPSTS